MKWFELSRIGIRRSEGPQMLLSQRRYKPQLQEEGTHPVRCQTRQSSPVRVHLHVCERRTFVESFSAYSNIRLQNPLLHVSHFQTQICSLTQVHRRWYCEGYSLESRSPPELIKEKPRVYTRGFLIFHFFDFDNKSLSRQTS